MNNNNNTNTSPLPQLLQTARATLTHYTSSHVTPKQLKVVLPIAAITLITAWLRADAWVLRIAIALLLAAAYRIRHRLRGGAKPSSPAAPPPVHFYDRDAPFYQFANFWAAPIIRRGRAYACTEVYFQAAKFRGSATEIDIASCSEPRQAYDLARKRAAVEHYRRCMQPGWRQGTAGANVSAMMEALEAKFVQHPDLAELLLSTGEAEIVERTPAGDPFWGDASNGSEGKGSGLNMLGKLLMQVRQRLRHGSLLPVAQAQQNICRWCGIRRRAKSHSGALLLHCEQRDCKDLIARYGTALSCVAAGGGGGNAPRSRPVGTPRPISRSTPKQVSSASPCSLCGTKTPREVGAPSGFCSDACAQGHGCLVDHLCLRCADPVRSGDSWCGDECARLVCEHCRVRDRGAAGKYCSSECAALHAE